MAKTKKEMKRGKKLGGSIESLRDDKGPGKITRGIFLKVEPLLKQDGSPVEGAFDQQLHKMTMADLDTGEERTYWADGGIRGQLTLSKVVPDMPIEIEHTGQTDFTADDGKKYKVQTYAIYSLE